jgi:hypothetical protein
VNFTVSELEVPVAAAERVIVSGFVPDPAVACLTVVPLGISPRRVAYVHTGLHVVGDGAVGNGHGG